MKKVKYILIWFLLITTSLVSVSQSSSLVYIKNGNFIKDCSIWKPKILNYTITVSKLPDNSTIISPNIGGFNVLYHLRCSTATDGIARIKADFQYMKDLNIDAVRITGLTVDADDLGDLNVKIKHFVSTGDAVNDLFNINGATNQNKLIGYIETVLDIAEEFDIKVILLTGHDDYGSTNYLNYLSNLATSLKNHTALFAYDMYNEPTYSKTPVEIKSTIYQLTEDWYSTIRNTGDNHLITLGNLSYTDIFTWDPHILKIDFYSFHIYPNSISDFKIHTKWFDEVLNKPWIIGEIGKSGHDNTICPATVSELDQKDFAISTLNTTFDCDGKGYSWWKYHDGTWCNSPTESCLNDICHHNYFGIINKGSVDGLILDPTIQRILYTPTSNPIYTIQGSPKQLAFALKNYVYSNNVCDRPSDYYTAFSGDKSVQAYPGKVINTSGVPIANAVIHAYYQINGTGPYYHSYTFSDNSGNFAIYPKNGSYTGTLSINVSYPGKNVITHYYNNHNSKTITLSNLGYDASSYFNNEIVVSSGASEIWLEDKKNISQITVDNNAILTIKSNINMLPEGEIIVKAGGKLIIDGGTITSDCGLWQGIIVQGNAGALQTPETNQGVLEMKNGATISNAEIGVYVRNSAVQNNHGGGIIKLDDAHFLNNQKDIVMLPYELWSETTQKPIAQLSYIKRTSFKNDANMLMDVHYFGKQGNIYTYGINGLKIQGNTFENLDNTLAVSLRGTGISSRNSSLIIEPYCDPNISPCTNLKNQFKNLHYGIIASENISSMRYITIDNNLFDNTTRSILLTGTHNAEITLNDIKLPGLIPNGTKTPYGIYLMGGSGYTIEDNYLYKTGSTMMFNGTRGIIVENTGENNNKIFNNDFSNLFLGIQSQYENSGFDEEYNEVGLVLLCNTSQTSFYDFVALGKAEAANQTPNPNYARIGFAMHQQLSLPNPNNVGNLDYPAGNDFSTVSGRTGDYQFDNDDANSVIYSYDASTNASANAEPTLKSNVYTDPMYTTNPCQSNTGGNGTAITTLYTNLANAKLSLNTSKLILSIWKDGGNANLDEEVESTLPWEAYQQFNDLLAESPYLSEEVLLETVNNPVFTSLMVKLIMVANPHCTRSEEIMMTLEERIPAMPQSYIDEIRLGESNISQLEILKGNVASDNHLVSMIGEDIKRNYKKDYENRWATDSLIAFMSRQPNLVDKFELASIYFDLGKYTNMESVFTDISNMELDDIHTQDYTNFVSMMNIATTAKQEDLLTDFLSETQVTNMETILNSKRANVSSFALAILKQNNADYEFNEEVLDVSESSARLAHFYNKEVVTDSPSDYRIFPNPSKDYITLEYTTQSEGETIYSIRNGDGKVVLQKLLPNTDTKIKTEVIIDVQGFAAGVYYFNLISNGENLNTQKLVIIK